MASVNKAIIIGNLGQDPVVRYTSDGGAIANISVATTESWKDKQTGEKKEITEWHRITFYKQLAEVVGKYLKKGSQVYAEGRLQTRKWIDKDGIERYTTEIIADTMRMLGGKPDDGGGGYESGYTASPADKADRAAKKAKAPPPRSPDDMDDDIPF